MTLLRPRLSLRRLMVFHKGHAVYDQAFHDGVNIIRGSNSSGKSTIADFIFFALGGDLNKWKPEAETCEYVIAEIDISGVAITVKREVSKAPRQGMAIYWGSLEAAAKSMAEGWQVYPFARSKEKESFSQALFRALDLPEVKGDGESNITMHQLLRLIYVDQMSGVDALMRTEGFDSSLTRTTVGDLLFGIYDDSLYSDELKLRATSRELDVATEQFKNILAILGRSELEVDLGAINKALEQTEAQRRQVHAELEKLASSEVVDFADGADGLKAFEVKGAEFRDLKQKLAALENEIERQLLEVEDSRQFVAQLEARQAALEDALHTRNILGTLPVAHCPQCLSPVAPPAAPGICSLCGKPVAADIEKAHVLRMQQELALHIRDSKRLLSDKEKHAADLKRNIPALTDRLRRAQSNFEEVATKARSKRDEKIDNLLVQKGAIEARLDFLHKQAKAVLILEELKTRCARLKADVSQLGLSIKTKRTRQEKRKKEAAQRIEEYTLQLLKSDLPREEIFRTGTSVTVDFANNRFGIDGRNQFSASSTIYLKNCVHFAIFFASLELEFFRYPRFIICDNMEDKGMEEERSHNFQKVIVEAASKFTIKHQIIFTTSMIESSLNNTPLCVGSEYSQAGKSLEIKKGSI